MPSFFLCDVSRTCKWEVLSHIPPDSCELTVGLELNRFATTGHIGRREVGKVELLTLYCLLMLNVERCHNGYSSYLKDSALRPTYWHQSLFRIAFR